MHITTDDVGSEVRRDANGVGQGVKGVCRVPHTDRTQEMLKLNSKHWIGKEM